MLVGNDFPFEYVLFYVTHLTQERQGFVSVR